MIIYDYIYDYIWLYMIIYDYIWLYMIMYWLYILVGGFNLPTLKNDALRQLGKNEIPNWMESHKIHVPNQWKVIKFMFQTTNQIRFWSIRIPIFQSQLVLFSKPVSTSVAGFLSWISQVVLGYPQLWWLLQPIMIKSPLKPLIHKDHQGFNGWNPPVASDKLAVCYGITMFHR